MRRSSDPTKFLVVPLALSMIFSANPIAAQAQSVTDIVSVISALFAPPAIPTYLQPPDPAPNDIWTPGYWASGNGGYYWVPGTWVPAPAPGLLWTPGYWAANTSTNYVWNQGYWAPAVGYYGGVNYGYGYYGQNYVGGRWQGSQFRYNTAITNVNRTVIRNVYVDRTVVVNHWNHVSYNGGRDGLTARPTQSELDVRRGHRVFATNVQMQHQRIAEERHASFSSVNHGRPAIAAVAHPFSRNNMPAVARHTQPEGRTAAIHPEVMRNTPAHFAPQHSSTQYAAPQHMAPQHAAAQNFAPRHAEPQHVASQHAAAQNAPQHAVPQNVAPQHAAPAHEQGHDKHGEQPH